MFGPLNKMLLEIKVGETFCEYCYRKPPTGCLYSSQEDPQIESRNELGHEMLQISFSFVLFYELNFWNEMLFHAKFHRMNLLVKKTVHIFIRVETT